MNIWNKQDLALMELDDKILTLKEMFDKKKGTDVENYAKKLNSFINRNLAKESEIIFKRHLFISVVGISKKPKGL